MTDEKIDGALSVAASQALEAQFNSAALAGRNRLAHTEYPLLLSSLEENCTWFVDVSSVGVVGRLISLSVLT